MNTIGNVQFMAIDVDGVLWYMAFVVLFYVECIVGVWHRHCPIYANKCKMPIVVYGKASIALFSNAPFGAC
jgi:hypothetical protein